MTASVLVPGSIRLERLRQRVKSWREFARRYRRQRAGLVGLAILAAFAILAFAPQLFVGPLETATTATGPRLSPPSPTYLLGTDEIGRGVLNLVVWGSRVSLLIGILATVVNMTLGTIVGLVAGYLGGKVDQLLMRLADFFLIVPSFVVALILAGIVLQRVGTTSELFGFRISLFVTIMVIGITSWASTARIVRSMTLSLRERAFVDRARSIGSGSGHIMLRHIFPNIVPVVVANSVLHVVGAIYTETSMSFIGLGDPFQPSWGTVLYFAQQNGAAGSGAWWYMGAPGMCIVLVVLGFTLAGNALEATLNPRLKDRR